MPGVTGYPAPRPFSSAPASSRGWGPGWPNCQSDKLVTVRAGGVSLPVRREVADLVTLLVKETERLGYDLKPGWCWGFACRAISGTSVASNHSWGLAVDINAPVNPYAQPRRTDIPPKVVALWQDHGFRWGGFYNDGGTTGPADSMHFEYMGTPDSAKADTVRARSLGHPPYPVPGDTGDRVRRVQRRLNRLGYGHGLRLDGHYGEETRRAVRRFQRDVGFLDVDHDGKFGPVSWATLMHPKLTLDRVQPGKTNWQIRFVQAALNVVLDPDHPIEASGHFGGGTADLYRRWQRRVNDAADPTGVPGRRGLEQLGDHYGFTVR